METWSREEREDGEGSFFATDRTWIERRFFRLTPEAQKKVAHGETVGSLTTEIQAPDGATENQSRIFLSPLPGLDLFGRVTHGFTVGYYRSLLHSYGQTHV